MSLHPAFDPVSSSWFVEVDGIVREAPSLKVLQHRFPRRRIIDYYPDGYSSRIEMRQPRPRETKRRYSLNFRPLPASPEIAPEPEVTKKKRKPAPPRQPRPYVARALLRVVSEMTKEEEDQFIVQNFNRGYSYGQIARALGHENRNMIAGRLARLRARAEKTQ